jgi:hypothetical protein
VRIYIFEEFIRDPVGGCRDIFRFLGVDSEFKPTIAVHNKARRPISPRLQYWLRTKGPDHGSFLSPRLKESCLRALMEVNTRLGWLPRADRTVERELMDRYRSDVDKLEQLLGRDLSLWRTEIQD